MFSGVPESLLHPSHRQVKSVYTVFLMIWKAIVQLRSFRFPADQQDRGSDFLLSLLANGQREIPKFFLSQPPVHTCHVFTVDDLNHLYRGGRVSKATAVLGTLANIKPMLHVDNEGKLIPVGKVRGRKKSLATLVSMMEDRIGDYRGKNEIVLISHGDCEEDAAYVAKLVEEKFGITNVMMNPIGATIGAHAGPGTVALFFLGEYR